MFIIVENALTKTYWKIGNFGVFFMTYYLIPSIWGFIFSLNELMINLNSLKRAFNKFNIYTFPIKSKEKEKKSKKNKKKVS